MLEGGHALFYFKKVLNSKANISQKQRCGSYGRLDCNVEVALFGSEGPPTCDPSAWLFRPSNAGF